MPIGSMVLCPSDNIPSGWWVCDGRAVSRTTYKALFEVIGTIWGEGDGSTTFNIPDCREVTPVGAGTSDRSAITEHDSYTVGQFKDDQFQGHKVQFNVNTSTTDNSGANYVRGNSTEAYAQSYSNDSLVSDGTNGTPRTGSTTHGKQLGMNYIIKYSDTITKQVALINDDTVAEDKTLSSSKINKQNSYLTDEVDTGKTWIDGKKIYRKVVTGLSFGDVSETWTNIFQLNEGETLVNAYSMRSYDNSVCYYIILRLYNSNIQYYVYDDNRTSSTWNFDKIVIEYTKTSD